jgi:hypothetical protein
MDLNGVNPVSFANIQTIGITNNDPRLLAATNVTTWFYGWTPQLAPNILNQPTNLTVTAGQTAQFTVEATGISAPAYQWLQNGTNAPYASANTATLVITNAQTSDAASYSVIVSNAAGSVTSSTVTLQVITPLPPTMSGISSLSNGGIQFTISGTQGVNYRVWASTNLALTPVVGAWDLLSSGTFGSAAVVFTDLQATNFMERFYIITVP